VAINTTKVAVGGVAASVVNLAFGFLVYNVLLGPRMNAELDAVVAGGSAKMMAGTANMVIGLGGQVVIGFLLAWLYAALRPRFGPGMMTAAYAGLVLWLAGFVFYSGWYSLGAITGPTYFMASAGALVINIAAAAAAGFLYKEEGA
jgi:hypothetical protein